MGPQGGARSEPIAPGPETSIPPTTDNPDWRTDWTLNPDEQPWGKATQILVPLIQKIRPGIPDALAESFAFEYAARIHDVYADHQWNLFRDVCYPDAVHAARNALQGHLRNAHSFDQRRREELAAVAPQPGDYMGGPVPWEPQRKAS